MSRISIDRVFESNGQLPSPPLSPVFNYEDIEIKNESLVFTEREVEYLKSVLDDDFDNDETITVSNQDEAYRKQYMIMMEEGLNINNEMVSYFNIIERLHAIGNEVINKRTKDSVPLRVYNNERTAFEDYWVHPIFLSLQSFQFFKIFEDIKNEFENQPQEMVEIEVPSLKAFPFVLNFMYNGDKDRLLQVARLDESICQGIMENLEYLEINMSAF